MLVGPRVWAVRSLEIAHSQVDVRLRLFLTHRLSIARDSSKERSAVPRAGALLGFIRVGRQDAREPSELSTLAELSGERRIKRIIGRA